MTLIDVNDSPPEFSQNIFYVEIQETVAIGSFVYNMAAKDNDTNPRLSYVISENNGRFSIDNTGRSKKGTQHQTIICYLVVWQSIFASIHVYGGRYLESSCSIPFNVTWHCFL